MSYKVEVQTVAKGPWDTNGIRLATFEEANDYGHDLFMRWTMAVAYRVAESDDPVNYVWRDGHLEPKL